MQNSSKKIRVIAGKFRGKIIPFDNSKFDEADITPQRVKGAVFSILGEDLHGLIFLDMFAGSGQMGFEAMSRGAEKVIFFERDRKRLSFIENEVKRIGCSSSALVFGDDSIKLVGRLIDRSLIPDIIFVDPPYVKETGADEPDIYSKSLNAVSKIAGENTKILVQHFHEHILPDRSGKIALVKTKKYGKTLISVYEVISS